MIKTSFEAIGTLATCHALTSIFTGPIDVDIEAQTLSSSAPN